MHVLIPEVHSAGAQAAAEGLRAAGHTAVVCHPEGVKGRWCVALEGGKCPLETLPVDAAVVVRSTAEAGRLPFEDGVLCAARRFVPLVVAGAIDPVGTAGSEPDHPYRTWAAAEQEGSDVTATVETVVASPLPKHCAVATRAFRHTLETHGLDPADGRVEVRRRNGGLVAEIFWPSGDADPKVSRTAAVRVSGTLRGLDPWARSLDVTINRTEKQTETMVP